MEYVSRRLHPLIQYYSTKTLVLNMQLLKITQILPLKIRDTEKQNSRNPQISNLRFSMEKQVLKELYLTDGQTFTLTS